MISSRINEALSAATDLADERFDADVGELEGRVIEALEDSGLNVEIDRSNNLS
jgi:hypothetical protein